MVDCLQNELNAKNEYIKTLSKQCNDTEWSLGEHRQWLNDSTNRIEDLTKELCKSDDCIKQLRQEIENQNADISNCLETIDVLNSQFSAKSDCIANLEKAKNDTEWSLGEHRQWLQNANERIAEFKESEIVKDTMIKELHNEIDELSKKVVLDLKAALEAVKKEMQQEKTEVSQVF
ncbi:hypothetical protein LOAG_16820 [Loa loa]|uniref:Uncharacterized protein n=1 Tax=Loa loa TaxID=7209 RepID=A0A1S0UKU2_LOALO|nr:hypothetical protein LOAG_16820 [Loa loa]EJD76185.1 hypothetical protein LOAG_16820 [Loa loa]